jgi:hypothetical protein
VPVAFRPLSAQTITGGATLTEANFRTLLANVFTQYGKRQNLVMVLGTTVKGKVTDFTASQQAAGSVALQSSRYYTAGLDANKVITNISIYEGDFQTVELYPSLLLAGTTAGVADSTNAANRAYIIPPELFGMTYNRAPRVMKLPDQGGGPRALVDAICCLVVKNPLTFGKVST